MPFVGREPRAVMQAGIAVAAVLACACGAPQPPALERPVSMAAADAAADVQAESLDAAALTPELALLASAFNTPPLPVPVPVPVPVPGPSTRAPLRAGPLDPATVTVDPATCTTPGLVLEFPLVPPVATCEKPASCTQRVPFRVVNCTADEILPTALAIKSPGVRAGIAKTSAELLHALEAPLRDDDPTDQRVTIEGVRPIPARTALKGWVVELPAGTKSTVELAAERTRVPGMFTSARATVDVIDRTLAAAVTKARAHRAASVAACRSRGGSYEIVGGLMAVEECVFPFPDADRVCHDKSQCRGECLMTSAVPLGNGKVRLDGKCSRLETTFGCAGRIGRTPGGTGIVSEKAIPPAMCVD